jgi:hypothetical protein
LFRVEGLDFRVARVFIDMMDTDNLDSATASAAAIPDARVSVLMIRNRQDVEFDSSAE